jgi:Domain of unknown function DUF29
MPDDLYNTDFVRWTEHQAERLRRLERGERVNDLDWPNLIEEVEGLGKSEVAAVQTLLLRGLEHLLKAAAWPDAVDAAGWRHEAAVFLRDARRRSTPSMDQQLDIGELHATAVENVLGLAYREGPPGPLPAESPFTVRNLLPRDRKLRIDADALVARLRA